MAQMDGRRQLLVSPNASCRVANKQLRAGNENNDNLILWQAYVYKSFIFQPLQVRASQAEDWIPYA